MRPAKITATVARVVFKGGGGGACGGGGDLKSNSVTWSRSDLTLDPSSPWKDGIGT